MRTGERRYDADLVGRVAGLRDEAGAVEREGALAAVEGAATVVGIVARRGRADRSVGDHAGECLEGLDIALALEVELAILGEEAAAIVEDGVVEEVRAAGIAGGEDAELAVLGRRLGGLAQFRPGRRHLEAGGVEHVLAIEPDADVDAPGQRDIVIVIAQRIDCPGQEVVEIAARLHLLDQVVDRPDRAEIIELHGLIAGAGRKIRRGAGADRRDIGLVPVVPGNGAIFDLDSGIFLVELGDKFLGRVDIFRRTPDHVPEIQFHRVGRIGGDGRETDGESGREGCEEPCPAPRGGIA